MICLMFMVKIGFIRWRTNVKQG